MIGIVVNNSLVTNTTVIKPNWSTTLELDLWHDCAINLVL